MIFGVVPASTIGALALASMAMTYAFCRRRPKYRRTRTDDNGIDYDDEYEEDEYDDHDDQYDDEYDEGYGEEYGEEYYDDEYGGEEYEEDEEGESNFPASMQAGGSGCVEASGTVGGVASAQAMNAPPMAAGLPPAAAGSGYCCEAPGAPPHERSSNLGGFHPGRPRRPESARASGMIGRADRSGGYGCRSYRNAAEADQPAGATAWGGRGLAIGAGDERRRKKKKGRSKEAKRSDRPRM